MKIGISGPIIIEHFYQYLEPLDGKFEDLPTGLGGTPVNQLSLSLLERGYELTIFTLDKSVTQELVLIGKQLKICIGPYRKSGRAKDFFKSERSYICDAIKRERPDIVHAHWTYEFALGALDSGIPTIVTAHDAPWLVLRYMPNLYRVVRLIMSLEVSIRSHYLTAVGPTISKHFNNYMFFKKNIPVIPNSLPNDIFKLRNDKAKSSVLTFASVLNGWTNLKNAKKLLRAFKIVSDNIIDCRLLMFGAEYGMGEQASKWATENGLGNNVEFIGFLKSEKLYEALADKVDILVHPSLEESFSMAIAEAMALGIPTIGGQHSGGVPSTLENGRVGILADVKSPPKLAKAMMKLANNKDRIIELGNIAFESAQKRFSASAVADMYERQYKNILAKQMDQKQ